MPKKNKQNSAGQLPAFGQRAIAENEIEQSLSEIYQDDDGHLVDVQKIEKKKRLGVVFWFPFLIFWLALAIQLGWFYYQHSINTTKTDQVRLSITADKDAVAAGEPFTYTATIINLAGIPLRQVRLKVSYPQNFVALAASPRPQIASSSANNEWLIQHLAGFASYKIKIKGALVGQVGQTNTILAQMTYAPGNFSSVFKKSASLDILVNEPGLDVSVDAPTVALLGEKNEISVSLAALADNFIIDSCQLAVEAQPQDAVGFVSAPAGQANDFYTRSSLKPNVWHINKIAAAKQEVPIDFIVTDKNADKIDFNFIFTYFSEAGRPYQFLKKQASLTVMKSDLNLSLIINGSKNDQGINIGDQLHYSIFYANKGEASLKNVMIMAVIDGPVDWSSLTDPAGGLVRAGTITWSKEQIPALALIAPDSEGEINFSLAVASSSSVGQSAEIKSYAQYLISSSTKTAATSTDNRSNVIVNKINSRLDFVEKVLYFNEDNITLGSGPVPPSVGATTTYRVFWRLGGNIHELSRTKVSVKLPPYVHWADKANANVGNLDFAPAENSVVWSVGKLPVIAQPITAEFDISLKPTEQDVDKILVLLPPAAASAIDTETDSEIKVLSPAKTSKLEDDEIAASDGRVRP